MALPNWSPKIPQWSNEDIKLLLADNVSKPPKPTLEYFMSNSEKFPVKFPVDTGRCKTLKNKIPEAILERNISSVYPILHESALELYCKFILYKRQHGTSIEKSVYQNITLLEFINRLLKKRAVSFVGTHDYYLLLSKNKGYKNWETIGTEKEQPPVTLQNCISYDEIKLSAFLSVSSYTHFVNIGDRENNAKYTEDRKDIEDEGVIIGLIGTRLAKEYVMEFQEIVIDELQNTTHNGYGTTVPVSIHKLFADFYEEPCRSYTEVLNHKNTLPITKERYYMDPMVDIIFDNHFYYKRLAISADTLLMEANYRALKKGTTAFVHVVGLGLGVWKIFDHQDKVYMDTFAKRLALLGNNLFCISDVCFAYIDHDRCGACKDGEIFPIEGHPLSGIKIHINQRQPHTKLLGSDAGKILIVSYAWDANALPGNEYWSGYLGDSSDSAAASSTEITEIHNPHINPLVDANNLMVVTRDGVVSFEKYQEDVRCRHQNIKQQ